jgi:hypothetical protein
MCRRRRGLRRDRVERVVKAGARSSNSKAVGQIGRMVRDALLPIIFRRAEKDAESSLTWMHGHHIEWSAPLCAETSA